MLILFCVLLLINIVIGASLVQWVLKPIRALQGRMKKVEEGTLDAYYTLPGTHDEIDSLGQSYNAMLDEIISLIDKIYQEQAEKRQAELKVLRPRSSRISSTTRWIISNGWRRLRARMRWPKRSPRCQPISGSF